MADKKRRWGDRRDARYLRDLDPMHKFMPLLYPGRCDNEAYITERFDLTAVDAYLERKNAALGEDGFKYTLFHVVVTAMLKTLTLRPKMNWFIANKKLYERNEVSASFVVKKQFADNGAEALAIIHSKPDDTLDSIHEAIRAQVQSCRSDKLDDSSAALDTVGKLPFWLVRFVVWVMRILDARGLVPASLVATDPYYSSVVLSNIGSIKLKCGYHHLTNWGTNSVFCIVAERKVRPFFNEDGSFTMHDSVDLGLTIDERIADGYYYSKSIRLLKKLLAEPELLDLPLSQEVDY